MRKAATINPSFDAACQPELRGSKNPNPGASVSPKRLFRALALAEAVTWTILIVAMILKYAAGVEWAVLVGGSIHGFVFLAYAFAAVLVGVNQRWSVGLIGFAVVTAIVPYATIPFEHPADGSWVNRMLRWFLARPVLLTVLAVVGIAAVFTALLVIGPPGGREA
jgi:integral membrane protein